jgi:hypothetical protein
MTRLDRKPLIVAGGSLIASTLIMIGSYYDLNKSEWAAWVQAIGSIAAILGAFWISHRQVVAASRDVHSRRVALLDSAAISVASAAKLVEKLRDRLSVGLWTNEAVEPMKVEIHTMQWTIDNIVVADADDARTRGSRHIARSVIHRTEQLVDRWARQVTKEKEEAIRIELDHLIETINRAADGIVTLREQVSASAP